MEPVDGRESGGGHPCAAGQWSSLEIASACANRATAELLELKSIKYTQLKAVKCPEDAPGCSTSGVAFWTLKSAKESV